MMSIIYIDNETEELQDLQYSDFVVGDVITIDVDTIDVDTIDVDTIDVDTSVIQNKSVIPEQIQLITQRIK